MFNTLFFLQGFVVQFFFMVSYSFTLSTTNGDLPSSHVHLAEGNSEIQNAWKICQKTDLERREKELGYEFDTWSTLREPQDHFQTTKKFPRHQKVISKKHLISG